MVIFPTCSVTFPRYQRAERGPYLELSAAFSEQNELGVSVIIWMTASGFQLWSWLGRDCGSMSVIENVASMRQFPPIHFLRLRAVPD